MPVAEAQMTARGLRSIFAIASLSRCVPLTRLSRIFRFCSSVQRPPAMFSPARLMMMSKPSRLAALTSSLFGCHSISPARGAVRTRRVTSCPCASNAGMSAVPTRPLAPASAIFINRSSVRILHLLQISRDHLLQILRDKRVVGHFRICQTPRTFFSLLPPMTRRLSVCLVGVTLVLVCFVFLNTVSSQSTLRRITNTSEEGISLNPSISGDGRIVAFESTEDVAGAGGIDHFRAIRANVSSDPAAFLQMAGSRAVTPAISQDGLRIAFASRDNPLGTNIDGNSEIFLFDGSSLRQVTNSSPGSLATRTTDGNFQPSISDDGRFIAFSSNRNFTGQNSDANFEIFIWDTNTSSFSQLTNSSAVVGSTDAKLSGDGSTVAYIHDQGTTASAARDLLKQPRSGGSATVL